MAARICRDTRRLRAGAARVPAGPGEGRASRRGRHHAGHVHPGRGDGSPYDGNAYGIAQGKRLFRWYNCNGCHANGGGGFGPPLMDDKWIYGHQPQNIFATIVEGRPNGMPSFRGRIPDDQVWQLVAYVRSMSGLVPMDAAPGRNDSIHPVEPELRRDPLEPKPAGVAGPR